MEELKQRPWISLPETEATLGLSRSCLYDLIDDGHLVRVKVGRRSFVTTASIAEYIRQVAQ